MFATLGRLVYRRRWLVVVAGIIFLVASALYGTSLFSQLKSGGFYDPAVDSSKVTDALHTKLGQDPATLLVLFQAKNGETVDQPAFQAAVQTTLAKVQGKAGVGTITDYYTTHAAPLVSADKQATYAVVGLTGDDDAQAQTMKVVRPLLTSDLLQVRLSGYPAVSEDMNRQVSADLELAETASFPILAVLLVFIFGSVVAASLPLIIGVVAILGSFLILRLIANFTDISIFAINIITILGLGLAIDYSLFMVSRFREELARSNGAVQPALLKTMQTAGRTVMFSGLTVVISLLSLLVFPQMFLKSMGMGGSAAVLVAMLSALTILPAILALVGTRINALSVWSLFRRRPAIAATSAASPENSGFWYRSSRFVMRHPISVVTVTLALLVFLGLPFLRVNFVPTDARSLPATAESRVVLDILNTRFPANETSPVQILVETNGDATSAANLAALYDYTRQVQAVPGVRRVDSLVNLDPALIGKEFQKADYLQFYAAAPQARAVAANFSKNNTSLVSVLYDGDPVSGANQDLVRHLRSLTPPAGLSPLVGGTTAQAVDMLASLGHSVPYAFGVIVAVIFVLLFLMLGSIVIPVKAVLLNILSLSVSFGAMVWVFQDGNFAGLLNFTSTGGIDASQPVLIFAIAFGLSMDYEVFLLSRIKENYNRTHDTPSAVAAGVQHTGRIITSAALLLVVVIGSFMTGQVLFIKQIGLGLGLAVAVDATLVRMLLVPATMRLLGKYNWWAPRPLAALYRRLNLGEVAEPETAAPAPVIPALGLPERESAAI
jgi:RND superfamily putative drug exporter